MWFLLIWCYFHLLATCNHVHDQYNQLIIGNWSTPYYIDSSNLFITHITYFSFEDSLCSINSTAYAPYTIHDDTLKIGYVTWKGYDAENDKYANTFIITQLDSNIMTLRVLQSQHRLLNPSAIIQLRRIKPIRSFSIQRIGFYYGNFSNSSLAHSQYVELDENGNILLDGRDHEGMLGLYRGHINTEAIDQINTLVQSFELDSLQSYYEALQTHASSYRIQIHTSLGIYETGGYGHNGEPPGLLILVNKLNHLYKTIPLTHDTSVIRQIQFDNFYTNRRYPSNRKSIVHWSNKISYYINNRKNETYRFSDYAFVFTDERKLLAILPDTTYTGSWSSEVYQDDKCKAETHTTLNFNTTNELALLNGKYKLYASPGSKTVYVGMDKNQHDSITFEIIPRRFLE